MSAFLYWGFGVFLYFKIAIVIADLGYDADLTVLASLLISIVFCITLFFTTAIYFQKLSFSNPINKNTLVGLIKITAGSYITFSIIFGILSRLIVIGFSKSLNESLHDDEELTLMTILLFPLFLHYFMVVMGTNLSQKPPINKQNTDTCATPEENSEPIIFQNNQDAFAYACKFMGHKIKTGELLTALVFACSDDLDSNDFIRNLKDLYQKVTSDKMLYIQLFSSLHLSDDKQNYVLKVASEDGGFYVVAELEEEGMEIKPNDLVMWNADIYIKELAKRSQDKRFGWCGLIVDKVEPQLDGNNRWKTSS